MDSLQFTEILDALKSYNGMSSKTGRALLNAFIDERMDGFKEENKVLRDAITKHRNGFLSEPRNDERELWKVLEND